MSSESGEFLNRPPDLVERTSEDQEDGFTYANPRFVEHYINGDFYILVFFRIRGIDIEYCAYLQREHPAPGANVKIGNVASHVLPSCTHVHSNIQRAQASRGSKQEPVFVSIVEGVESPKNVIPSLVWFDVLDEVDSLIFHSLYLSSEGSLVLFGRRDFIENRESAFVNWGTRTVRANERAGQVIERTPKVLENIATDYRESHGNGVGFNDGVNELSRLRITLSSDFIRLGLPEGVESRLELYQVLIGPLDLF